MAEEFRVAAVVTDRFSKTLGALLNKLSGVQKTAQVSTRATNVEFTRFHRNVERITGSLRAGLEPSLAAVGLSSLSAGLAVGGVGAAIAGVVLAIRNFSSSAIELKSISRETGIAAEKIKALQAAAGQFGVDSGNISPALTKFAEKIRDIRRGMGGPLVARLQTLKPGSGAEKVLEDLKTAEPSKALMSALEFLSRVKEGPARAAMAEQLGLSGLERFVQDGIKPLQKALDDLAARQPILTDDDLAKARQFESTVAQIQARFDAMTHRLAELSLPWVSELVSGLDRAVAASEKIGALLSSDKMLGDKAIGIDAITETPFVGKAARGAVNWLKELFGIKEAGAAEGPADRDRAGQPPGMRQLEMSKFRTEVREGTKQGFIEALRQMMTGTTGAGIGGSTGPGTGGTGGGGSSSAIGAIRNKLMGGGGSGRSGGGGTGQAGLGAPVTGAQAKINRKETWDFLKGKGLSDAAAAAIIGSEAGESNFDPNAVGDHGASKGSFQWDAERRAAIQRAAGINVATAPHPDQLTAMWWETHHGDKGAQSAMRIAEDPNATMGQVNTAWVKQFERSRYQENDIRIRAGHATRALKDLGGGAQTAYESSLKAGDESGIPRHGTGYRAFADYKNFQPSRPDYRSGDALKAKESHDASKPFSPSPSGKASLSVVFKNAPPMSTHADGGSLFDKIELDRGRSMTMAK